MITVAYSENLKQAKDLYERTREATGLLEQILGRWTNPVTVDWDRSKDSAGHDLLLLRIADETGSESAVFAPSELGDQRSLRWRLNRLWGELLKTRSHKLMDQFLETSATQES